MGDPRKLKREYEKPQNPWEGSTLGKETKLTDKYGLKNKKEIWKAQSQVRKYREQARKLTGIPEKERKEKQEKFLEKLKNLGIIRKEAGLDNVLSLKTNDYLQRRLQTQAWKKGYGKTPKQARQLIVHGHIKINGRRTTEPGKIVRKEEEGTIDWYGEPVEHAKASKTPEEVAEEAREKGQIEEREETEEEEPEKEETEEGEYEKIVKENIPEVKEVAEKAEIDYEELLEAEKENKDRKTLKKWIKKKIGE